MTSTARSLLRNRKIKSASGKERVVPVARFFPRSASLSDSDAELDAISRVASDPYDFPTITLFSPFEEGSQASVLFRRKSAPSSESNTESNTEVTIARTPLSKVENSGHTAVALYCKKQDAVAEEEALFLSTTASTSSLQPSESVSTVADPVESIQESIRELCTFSPSHSLDCISTLALDEKPVEADSETEVQVLQVEAALGEPATVEVTEAPVEKEVLVNLSCGSEAEETVEERISLFRVSGESFAVDVERERRFGDNRRVVSVLTLKAKVAAALAGFARAEEVSRIHHAFY